MDRMASLTAFVRVVESGGFTAAARSLKLSPTMVSNHVQALEDSLGVRLLNRTTRRVGLTEIGREYYERCSQILQELAEADARSCQRCLGSRNGLAGRALDGKEPWLRPCKQKTAPKDRSLQTDLS